MVLVEDLDTLEAVMGRPLPAHIRDELIAESQCCPFTLEMRAAWREESAFGITRLHPSGEWIATLAPPGHPDPFAYRWLPEWLPAGVGPWHLTASVTLAGDDRKRGRRRAPPCRRPDRCAARNEDAWGLPPANSIDLEAWPWSPNA